MRTPLAVGRSYLTTHALNACLVQATLGASTTPAPYGSAGECTHTDLLNSSSGVGGEGVSRESQVRYWNWVTVRDSFDCTHNGCHHHKGQEHLTLR